MMKLGQRVRFTHTAHRVTTFVFRGQTPPDPRPDIREIEPIGLSSDLLGQWRYESEEEAEAAFRIWCAKQGEGVGYYMGYRTASDGPCYGSVLRTQRVLLIVVNPRHNPVRVFECHAEVVDDD